MLKVLLKKQLAEVFKGYFYDAKKNRMRSKARPSLVFHPVRRPHGRRAGRHVHRPGAEPLRPADQAGMGWLYFF